MPANLGISLHPDLEYDVVKVNDERYIIAHDLFDTVVEELEWIDAEVVNTFKGSKADRIVAKHPFMTAIHSLCSVIMLQLMLEQVVFIRHQGMVRMTFILRVNMGLKH